MGKREPENITRRHIEQKKKAMARARRRRFLRRMLALIICTFLLLLSAGAIYGLFRGAEYLTQEYHALYDGYTQRQQERRGTVNPNFDGYTNVLVLGLDDGAGPTHTEGQKADTVLVLSIENDTGRMRFITIPGDTWVKVVDHAHSLRLSSVYTQGGAPLMVRQVNALLGISIHQYVVVDLKAFVELIDALGGVDLYVENDMDYEDPESGYRIHLQKGYQHLDGSQSEQYLRYRGTELGDFGRTQRQQKFVKALYQQAMRLETIPKLPSIARIFRQDVDTSAEFFDSAHLANVLRHLSSEDPVRIMLPGTTAQDDDTIWLPDTSGIQKKMEELFPGEMDHHTER